MMEINETIKGFIVTELLVEQGVVSLTDADPLIDSGIIDSFGIMALMSFLEEKFSIQITGEELLPENFESIMRISAMVEQKIGCSLEA